VDRTLSEQKTPKEHTSLAETKDLNKKRKAEESLESTLTSYYYCTGLDLIIFEEPCIMCSMALSKKYRKERICISKIIHILHIKQYADTV